VVSLLSMERPSLAMALVNLHPAGIDFTQGISEADGTDWACSHNGSAACNQACDVKRRQSCVVVDQHPPRCHREQGGKWHHEQQKADPARAPPLDTDGARPGRQQPQEFGVEITAFLAARLPQLADDREAVVDDTVGGFGVAELDGPFEEFGPQQVFTFGG
jgi:hypothetical protein